jgi:hypothetical protein
LRNRELLYSVRRRFKINIVDRSRSMKWIFKTVAVLTFLSSQTDTTIVFFDILVILPDRSMSAISKVDKVPRLLGLNLTQYTYYMLCKCTEEISLVICALRFRRGFNVTPNCSCKFQSLVPK